MNKYPRDVLKDLLNFVVENEQELRELWLYPDYYGLINEWFIEEEDRQNMIDKPMTIPGPDNRLCKILYQIGCNLKEELERHLNDTRSREQKYNDSIKEKKGEA